MAQKITRVFHPTANSWQDVDSSAVKDWTGQGWTASKGNHIDDSEALPVEAAEIVVPAQEAKK